MGTLNKEKAQAMWLGPLANKKVKPLGLKWVKEILKYFSDLKALYNSDLTSNRDITLFNNREILIGRKPLFNKEWFAKGIRGTINHLFGQ